MSTPPSAAPIAVLAIHHQPVPAALPPVQTPVSMTSSYIVTASTPATLSYANSAPASFSPSSLSSTSLSGSKSSPPAVACLPPPATVMNGSTVGSGSTNGTTTSGGGSASGKDSGWLTLEVCREHVRQRCTRSDNECRFAHPPPHVDIQNGRVVCCFDSIKGRCQRTEPPCKYLHPPQHLKEQLLQNGRHNLIMKNLQQIGRIHQHTANGASNAATVLPAATAFIPVQVNPYLLVNHQSNCYASYYNANTLPPTAIVTPTSGNSNGCLVPGVAIPSASVAPAEQPVQEVEPGSSGAVDSCTYSTVQTTTGGNQPPGTQQYWTLSPSGGAVYTTNPLATPYYSHCYYQNGSYAIPAAAGPAGTTMLLAKRTPMAGGSAGVPVTANGLIEGCGGSKNGYVPSAVYGPCSTAAYQQMALSTGPIDLPSCYPMAITVPPPISGFYGC